MVRYIVEPKMCRQHDKRAGCHSQRRGRLVLDDSFRCHGGGANKGSVLPILADMYNVELENVMALGDQDNDAPMLSMAGVWRGHGRR